MSYNNKQYHDFLIKSIDITLFELEPNDFQINPQFKSLEMWLKAYVGPATAQFHGITSPHHLALRDENRNAILPHYMTHIDNKALYLSVKGCGAYEDMFFGNELTPEKIRTACQNKTLIPLVNHLSTGLGFIMGESWMGESPYGAQGEENAFDELNLSKLANKDNINGALICPVIGIVRLPDMIEKIACEFFWFQRYPKHFYQVLRLVPSSVRLYFESTHVIEDPISFLSNFGINSIKSMEEFELNFIKSGIALLSLYARSAKRKGDSVSGLIYQDVWLDKDVVVAPNGAIHFADLEGLTWKTVPFRNYSKTLIKEWQKLVYEFLYALIRIDTFRHQMEDRSINWSKQRNELALFVYSALEKDLYAYPNENSNNIDIIIETPSFPNVEIPLIEKVKL